VCLNNWGWGAGSAEATGDFARRLRWGRSCASRAQRCGRSRSCGPRRGGSVPAVRVQERISTRADGARTLGLVDFGSSIFLCAELVTYGALGNQLPDAATKTASTK